MVDTLFGPSQKKNELYRFKLKYDSSSHGSSVTAVLL